MREQNENGIQFQPVGQQPSLAKSVRPGQMFNQVPSTGLQANYLDYPSQDLRQSLGKGGSVPTPGMPDPAMGGIDTGSDMSFFNGGSMVGNLGQGLNLVGSGVSLVGMLQNMKDARKNNKLNRSNIRQQMSQSETAFNRAVERQDGTSEAIRERNERVAQMNQ
jgi:hypothetical protein